MLAARSFPLVCGVASMFLFRAAARRFLLPHAVPIAVGLFALSDWLIYYSAELKQYSCDLALTLVGLLLAAGPTPADRRRRGGCWRWGPSARSGVWFSYPLAFVLAGVGTYLLGTAAIRRDVRGVLGLAAVGLAWAASFAACFVVSHGILSKERFIWDWWDFAFLPLPPRSMAELKFDVRQLVNVFDSPADVKTPLGPIVTAILASALAIAGAVPLCGDGRAACICWPPPLAFVLAASALHQYPFHGRLLIFLVPSVQMLVGQGAAAIVTAGRPAAGDGPRRLPAVPAGVRRRSAPLHPAAEPRSYDSHGDLRPDLLDYLDGDREGRSVDEPSGTRAGRSSRTGWILAAIVAAGRGPARIPARPAEFLVRRGRDDAAGAGRQPVGAPRPALPHRRHPGAAPPPVAEGWVGIFGTSEAAARASSVLCGVLTVLLVFDIGRVAFDVRTGLWAAWLAALCPSLIVYAREARMYAWLVLVTCLCWRLLLALRRSYTTGKAAAYVLGLAALVYSHPLGLPMLATLAAGRPDRCPDRASGPGGDGWRSTSPAAVLVTPWVPRLSRSSARIP